MHIFTWKCYLFRMYFHLKLLPVQKYYFCTIPESLITNYFPAWTVLQCPHPHLGHNNFIRRAPSLKRGSFASCVCLLPTRGSPAWEPKLYQIPEIAPELILFGWGAGSPYAPITWAGKGTSSAQPPERPVNTSSKAFAPFSASVMNIVGYSLPHCLNLPRGFWESCINLFWVPSGFISYSAHLGVGCLNDKAQRWFTGEMTNKIQGVF